MWIGSDRIEDDHRTGRVENVAMIIVEEVLQGPGVGTPMALLSRNVE